MIKCRADTGEQLAFLNDALVLRFACSPVQVWASFPVKNIFRFFGALGLLVFFNKSACFDLLCCIFHSKCFRTSARSSLSANRIRASICRLRHRSLDAGLWRKGTWNDRNSEQRKVQPLCIASTVVYRCRVMRCCTSSHHHHSLCPEGVLHALHWRACRNALHVASAAIPSWTGCH